MKYELLSNQPMISLSALNDSVKSVMRAHIGHMNGITRNELFKKLFNHNQRPNDLSDYFRGIMLSRSLTVLKRNSNCFICTQKTKEGNEYFVVKTSKDIQIHQSGVNKRKKGLDMLQKRCEKAVFEKWWKQL